MALMLQKIRKIFSFRKNTRIFGFIFLFLLILGGLSLPSGAHAFVTALAVLVAGGIAWIAAAFILSIVNIILALCSVILMWSIDPWFIRVPYTSGGIVDIGWPIVRDIANMGIVLGLLVIGLATALRLSEYQARWMLPRLLIVALLINFTPVILGAIVDATNIVMYFFLEELTGADAVARQFTAIGSMIASSLGGFQFLNPIAHWALLFKILIVVIFNLIASIVFLLFAFLFIMRRIVIWMLVIFSPLAFLFWVFPATRRVWNLWWSQFWQWSIIGVFASFFLYLGEQMIHVAGAGGFIAEAPSGGLSGFLEKNVIDVLNSVLPYGIALIFLIFGFFMALQTSAFGSAGIIRAFQGGTREAGNAAKAIARARTIGAFGRELRREYRTVRAARKLGLPWYRGVGESVRREWKRRVRPALTPQAVGRATVAAGGGIISSAQDVGKAFRVGFARGARRRAQVICGDCGGAAPAGSQFCPHCGSRMP